MKKIVIIITIILLAIGCFSGCTEQKATENPTDDISDIIENKSPSASCSANPKEGTAPLNVYFVGSGSDSDGTIESYHWDFGDDTTSTNQNPSHTYVSGGSYSVIFKVTDNDGASDTDTTVITVSEGPINEEPTCALSVNSNSGEAPFTVTFYMTANDVDGTISSWELDINNDGTADYSDLGEPPSSKQHTYSDSGTYTAELTVIDNGSTPASDSVTITVTPPPPVKILSHSSYYNSGYFYVVGEVQNLGNNNIEFVKIVATFYNSAGEIIGTDFTYTELDILTPNQKSPFEVNSWPNEINVDHYELSVQYRTTSDSPYSNIEVLSHSSFVEYSYYKIIGEVQNTGSSFIEFVKIVITFYDSSGTVICKDFTYTDLDELSPGQKSPFEASSYPRKTSEMSIDTYSIEVQARKV